MGFYQTPADSAAFWKGLSDVTKAHTAYHQDAKKHVEAREHIVTLPYEMADDDAAALAKQFAEEFKKEHGVDCAAAIHWNKSKTNLHLHLVFSEREVMQQQKVSIAGRDTYFDANGKRSTKAKCVDADRNLLPGCRVVRKGEALYNKNLSGKSGKFFTYSFLQGEKERYAKKFSEYSGDEWVVYNHQTNPHLTMLNLVRDEPEGLRAWKERQNEKRRQYNATIDRMLDAGELTFEQALEIKKRVYAQQLEHRSARAKEREAWKRWHAEAPARRAAWVAQKEREWHTVHYNSLGLRRSALELVVLLGLTVAGVNVFKDGEFELGDDLQVRPDRKLINVAASQRLQQRVDEIYIAAGSKPPSERLAEQKVKKLGSVADRKPSLEEQIAGAAGKRSEPAQLRQQDEIDR